jgi:N-acetylmuramoyl-L-alanine amidase
MAHLTRRSVLGGTLGAPITLALAGTGGPRAYAAVEQVPIASCGEWGARPPARAVTVDDHRPNKIIIHHTAMGNPTDYSRAHAFQNSRDIQNLHMDTNGWIDSGQHFTNSRGGWLTEGRHGSLEALLHGLTMVSGAHCVGQNDQAIGIENEGTYLTEQPPPALWNRLVDLCAFACHQYGIAATEIYGHLDFNATQCPGLLHDRLPELRGLVAGRLA